MKSSIKKFLLINLLIAVAINSTLTAVGNYLLDQKNIQHHLDSLMAISALSYQALLGDDLCRKSIEQVQQTLNNIPKKIHNYYEKKFLYNEAHEDYLNTFNFQVVTKDGKLLLYSSKAPKMPLAKETDGFSDQEVSNKNWRVFTTHDKTGLRTVLAEKYDTRNELAHNLALDDLYIMLITFPFSALLIWIFIGRGLDSLDKVAQEVANRAPSYLEPVNLEGVPEEIKPVIDELNQLFFRLKEGFEREKRFAADAAHELKTPLAALKTQAQVALYSNDLEEKNQALQKLIANVNRSTHVVQQLLTISKLVPESSSIHEEETVNLIKLTREILAMLAPVAVEKQIELEFESDEKTPKIKGNSTALGILIGNLVDNAIRYCTEHGRIIVRLNRYHNKEVMLEVGDNGPGIAPELQSRVFERFFRVLGNKSPGSGLGLAIVQQICELHGGRVTLDTPKTGTGLIVRVFFPI